MPAPPEVLHRCGRIGIAEVLGEAEAEQAAEADGHVGVAREIEVDLQRVADHGQPGERRGELGGRQREDLVGGSGHDVGHEHLLGQTHDEAPGAVGEVGTTNRARGQLRRDVAVADDRAGDELWKEQQVERGRHRPLLRHRVATLHVDHVRDGVEGEERDADGQRDGRYDERREAGHTERRVHIGHHEAGVLEDAEHQQVGRHREPQQARGRGRVTQLAPSIDPQRRQIVHGNRAEHQPRERATAGGVERDAGHEQQRVPREAPRQGIEPEQHGQEDEEEGGFGEQHEESLSGEARKGQAGIGR